MNLKYLKHHPDKYWPTEVKGDQSENGNVSVEGAQTITPSKYCPKITLNSITYYTIFISRFGRYYKNKDDLKNPTFNWMLQLLNL